MKLIGSFFSSSSSSSRSKKKKGTDRERSETPSIGWSASSGGSDSFAGATTARGTPRTVIIGRHASGLDAEYWGSSSASSPPKAATPPAAAAAFAVVPPAAVSELFGVFDRDGDGKITKAELEQVLRGLGRLDPPSAEEVAMMVAEVDRDGDGCISLEEFRALGPALGDDAAAAAAAAAAAPGWEEELRDAFAVFDADGDGKISAEELLGVFVTLGDDSCTLHDCRRMIGGVDSSGDGFVCFQDFVRMMDGQR